MNLFKKLLSLTIVLIILGIITLIVLLCFNFDKEWKWILIALIILYGINICLNIYIFYSKKRTDKEKKCWIFINVILPIFGPLFFIKYGYYAYDKNKDEEIKSLSNKIDSLIPQNKNKINDPNFNILSNYAHTVSYTNSTNGNIQYIHNIEDLYEASIKMIRKAKKIILINFYIIADSIWFKSLINELLIKKQQGVKVFIEYDPFGANKKISKKTIKLLSKYGFYVSHFKPKQSLLITAIDNNRSHKKALIVDGKWAMYGGFNISDEYLNYNQEYHFWMDEGFWLQGAIVNQLIKSYIIDWQIYGDNNYDLLQEIKKMKIWNQQNTQLNAMQLYDANPEKNENRMHNFLSLAFGLAKNRIWIYTPYLYLSEAIIDQFISLSRSGVDIRIILPFHCDNKKFITEINAIQYEKLIENGIKIFETDAFTHRKSIVIDNLTIIGTTNLDQRAMCLNYENVIFSDDKKLNQTLVNRFKQDLEKAIIIKTKLKKDISIWNKIFVKLLMITETLL